MGARRASGWAYLAGTGFVGTATNML